MVENAHISRRATQARSLEPLDLFMYYKATLFGYALKSKNKKQKGIEVNYFSKIPKDPDSFTF